MSHKSHQVSHMIRSTQLVVVHWLGHNNCFQFIFSNDDTHGMFNALVNDLFLHPFNTNLCVQNTLYQCINQISFKSDTELTDRAEIFFTQSELHTLVSWCFGRAWYSVFGTST